MNKNETRPGLPIPLRAYIVLVGLAGMGLIAYLAQMVDWEPSVLGEMGLFILLIVAAGSFPLSVAPKVKADVTTAVWIAAALLLEPGAAALAGALGVVTYTLLIRFWDQKLRLPWYKYPFNAGQVALAVGLTSVLYHSLNGTGGLMTPAVIPAAAAMYMVNTALVSCAVSLQLRVNPLHIWWTGTRQSGPVELSLYAFGFLGALVYTESPWTVVAMFIPVAIIHVAFSRLSQRVAEREMAEAELKRAKEELEIRVEARTAELRSTAQQLARSRRRVVNAQEELRKTVAQQLHWPVQNRLLVAAHWLRNAQGLMASDMESAGHIARAALLLDEINQGDLRAAVRRLHPSLIRMSLEASLRSLAGDFQGSFDVGVRIHRNGPTTEALWRDGLPEELRLAIYRVAEEALSNVLKHASASRVDLALDLPEEGKVVMTVRDNGSGFDVDATTPGFGLLSMQDYCRAVGGTMQIGSVAGEGATISTFFPLSAVAQAISNLPTMVAPVSIMDDDGWGPIDPVPASHGDAEPVTTLLIVDDQPDFCGLVTDLLRPYPDFRILAEVHDGQTALSLVAELQPDVVLLDVEMPGIHGFETAERIHSRFPDINVVLMSAHHQQEQIQDALPQGTSDFIPKAEFSVNRLRRACRGTRVMQPLYPAAVGAD